MLDLSKIEAGQLTLAVDAYSMAAIVKSVVATTKSLARAKRLTLWRRSIQRLLTGHGDERRLTQVLLNLVGNAVKFTDTGTVEVAAAVVDGRFSVSVRDTGPGIAEADQSRVFEEFQQVEGTSTANQGRNRPWAWQYRSESWRCTAGQSSRVDAGSWFHLPDGTAIHAGGRKEIA